VYHQFRRVGRPSDCPTPEGYRSSHDRNLSEGGSECRDTATDSGVWQFDANGNFKYDGCDIDVCLSQLGNPGDIAVVGDWDGTGGEKLGFYNPLVSTWRLDYDGKGTWKGCSDDRCFSKFGEANDIPIAGDWDGTGKARIGVFRPSTGEWFLDKNGNGRLDACTIDLCIASFGKAGDRPLVGSW
jgi:hypothetical protein